MKHSSRTLLLFFCLCLFSIPKIQAQYEAIAKQGNIWYYHHEVTGLFGVVHHTTTIYAIEGDTLIGLRSYPILVRKDSALVTQERRAYCDEDTSTGTLTFYPLGSYSDTITYQQGLQIGDTISNPHPNYYDHWYLDSISSINDNFGKARNAFRFKAVDSIQCSNFPYPNHRWIEGIGSNESLFRPLPDCRTSDFGHFKLQCFFQNQQQVWGDTLAPCYKQNLGKQPRKIQRAFIYPTISDSEVHIVTESAIARIEVRAFHGQLVKVLEDSVKKVDISDLGTGVYFLQIQFINNTVTYLKFQKI